MADRTLTINHADGGSETYTLKTEDVLGVRNMSVDGETVTIDRTAPDLVRTIIADGQTITIDTTREGVRTLTVDGTEITIDRSEEANLESFLQEFTGASAAYSLRDLAGSGNTTVVRVRRASDNSEKDFSATDVSSGAMTDWVNTDVLTYESDFSSGTDGFLTPPSSAPWTCNIDSIGGLNDNLRLTSRIPVVNVNTYFRRNRTLSAGNSYRVTFDAYIPSTNSEVDDFSTVAFGTSQVNIAGQITLDQWTSYDVTGTANATALFIRLKGNSSGDATGDVVYIRNVQITQTTAHGFVETWYDQSGNGNDAVQQVSGSQPKIVDAGVLVTGGLKFDGVDDSFGTSLVPPNTVTLIGVANWNVVNQATFLIGARDSTDQRSYIGQVSGGVTALGVADGARAGQALTAGTDYLIFGKHSGITRFISTNGIVGSDAAGSAPNNNIFGYHIGAFNDAGTDSAFMDGSISEIIIYDSDQLANREAIEANINNQYDIY